MVGCTYDFKIESIFDLDDRGHVIANKYSSAVERVGDRFVFSGDEEQIAKVRETLRRNPSLDGKRQPRWLEPERFMFTVNLYVFDDKTVFCYGSRAEKSDLYAYILSNRDIANSMKSVSLFLWNHAHPIN